jgi:hypothetical protein
MNQDSDFTKTEKKVFLSLTGKDVDRVQLVSILEVLDHKFRERLAPYPECDDLFEPLLRVLGLRNQIRMYALLAITAQGLTLKLESDLKRIRNLIDLEFDWTRSPSREFDGAELQAALGYKSRVGFQKLRRKWNVSGKAQGEGAIKTYSRDEAWTLLRGKLAELPWWDAQIIARSVASKAKTTERMMMLDAIAPPRPASPLQRRKRSRRGESV